MYFSHFDVKVKSTLIVKLQFGPFYQSLTYELVVLPNANPRASLFEQCQ